MTSKLRTFLKKSSLLKRLKWEYEYLSGTWKFLDSAMEDGRFRNIISLMRTYCAASPSILEMGCGEGLLLVKCKDFVFSSYTGVDFSEVAIRRAALKQAGTAVFRVGDMNTWIPQIKFDVIIFNESIYYSDDAVETLARYARWLKAGGRIIVSVFIMPPTQLVLDKLLAVYQPFAQTEIVVKDMGCWRQFIFSFD